jgi:hypothetical protein
VVQIDIGERHSGKPFERIGWLDSPPSALLQAVETLTSQDEIYGLELHRDILQMLEAHPRIRKHYRFPERNRDLLLRADYAHAQPGESCSSCDPSNLVARTVHYDQNPVVHYGTMASSNAVINDAGFRDHIATKLNAISIRCYELPALSSDQRCGRLHRHAHK